MLYVIKRLESSACHSIECCEGNLGFETSVMFRVGDDLTFIAGEMHSQKMQRKF